MLRGGVWGRTHDEPVPREASLSESWLSHFPAPVPGHGARHALSYINLAKPVLFFGLRFKWKKLFFTSPEGKVVRVILGLPFLNHYAHLAQ